MRMQLLGVGGLVVFMLGAACGAGDDATNDGDAETAGSDLNIPGDNADLGRTDRPRAAAPVKALRYYVFPHADDEVESWSLVERDVDHYTVFMLLTHGEATQFCGGKGFDPGTNERRPQPQPFATGGDDGRYTKTCGDERIDAFHYFMDEMGRNGRSIIGNVAYEGRFTGEIRPGDTTPMRCDSDDNRDNCRSARDLDVWVGPRSARVVFDLGDGDLTQEEVVWAIRTVQRRRAELFPLTTEDDVVAAGYANANPLFGLPYVHGDHLAIHHAVHDTDFGTPGPQWGRTAFGDPDAELTLDVSGFAYASMFAVDPRTDARVGAHTVAYGWLAQPYYKGCQNGYACPFSKHQKFWTTF